MNNNNLEQLYNMFNRTDSLWHKAWQESTGQIKYNDLSGIWQRISNCEHIIELTFKGFTPTEEYATQIIHYNLGSSPTKSLSINNILDNISINDILATYSISRMDFRTKEWNLQPNNCFLHPQANYPNICGYKFLRPSEMDSVRRTNPLSLAFMS